MRRSLLALATLGACAHAQMPVARLDHAFPAGGKAGTEVEITIAGPDLVDVIGLVFDAPGFTVTKVDGLKFKVAVAADAARGMREVRAVGKYGISSPKIFVVGDAPEVVDAGANHTRETAVALDVPGVAEGRFEAEQRDFYKLTLKKDVAVLITCHSCALDSPGDPVITIFDSTGKTVGRGDDERDRDAVLNFVPPADGEYTVAVHDKIFGGGAPYLYRLALGEPPLALRHPGSAADFSVGQPKSIPEQEPNDTAATAQQIELPADVRGTFDLDWFVFQGQAGHALWLDVVADRADEEADPFLSIYKVTKDAKGVEQAKSVLELDDVADLPAPPRWQAATADPSGKFVPDETATYRIRVADRFGSHLPYRLIVRDAAPDFAVLALPESPLEEDKKNFIWQPLLRRGGGAFYRAGVLRRGYDGDITFRAEGLPEGVTVGGRISAGALTGTLVFNATADAKPWADFVHIFAEGGGVTREVAGLSFRWTVGNRDNERLDSRLCRTAIAVADEAAPISITAAEAREWEGTVGGTLEIPLTIARPAPLAQPKGEWQLSPVGFPGLAKFDPLKIDGAAVTTAKLVFNFAKKDGNDFAPGTYTFHLQARGVVSWKTDEKAGAKDGKDIEFSAPITVKLSNPPAATAAVSP